MIEFDFNGQNLKVLTVFLVTDKIRVSRWSKLTVIIIA